MPRRQDEAVPLKQAVPTHPVLNLAVLDVNLHHGKARVQVILLMLVDHDYKDCLQPGQLIEGSVAKY